jgi:hypothetical protein
LKRLLTSCRGVALQSGFGGGINSAMLFNIEVDEGSRVVGYLVPDAFSGSPSVRISDGKRDLLVLPCQEERASLVAAGRHATGRCGFTIDETIIADLARQESLELYDQDTNLLIYRRRPSLQVVHERIFRIETHLFPLWGLDDSIDRYFQHFHKGIERHGRETATQVFLLNNCTSLYLSGRLIFKTYENCINDTFNSIVLMRNPYMELAERLLTLKHVRKFGEELLGARDTMAYGAAISFAESIEDGEKALRRGFGAMPKAAIASLANPLTRQLAARTSDEAPSKGAIATALDTLSSFAIVGLRERQDLFLEALAELLGTTVEALPQIHEFAKTAELAGQLQHVPEAGLLIEQDLEVYHHVKSALDNTLDDDGVRR